MYKVTVCGHFGGKEKFFDGQTVKTKNIYSALVNEYGEENVSKLDTYGWKKNPFSFFIKCVSKFKNSKNFVILPAHNGIKVFIPLFTWLKRIYKTKVFYVVIGGWLPEKLKNKKELLNKIKKIDKIFVETNIMKTNLDRLNVKNVEVLVNFKNIKPLEINELEFNYTKPYKVCTFSRVMQEKGIEDAIEAIKEVNKLSKDELYCLDIYGPIDTAYEKKFEEILRNAPSYIKYKGCIEPDKSVEILKNYYLLLFPTKFYTEGIPGTIIDAFSAGIPVISSRWQNFNEIITEKYDGFGYDFGELSQLVLRLKELSESINVLDMKKNCLLEAKKYVPNVAIKNLTKHLI